MIPHLALALALLSAPRAPLTQARVDALVDRASETNMDQRAYRELLALGPRAIPFLIPRLDVKPSNESSVLYSALRKAGPAGVPVLAPALKSPTLRIRHRATMVVSAIRDPVVRPYLLKLLTDPDPTVRAQAALGCAYQLDPWGVPPLCALLARRDEHPSVTLAAARSLRFVASKLPEMSIPGGTTERLADLLDHEHYGVREAAMMALEDIGPASVSALEARLARSANASAALALGTIVGEHARLRATPAAARFELLLAHADAPVRAAAAEALWVWGVAGRTRALAMLSGEGHPMVRRKLMQVLSRKPTPRPDGL